MQVVRSLARLTRPIVTFQRTKVTISNEDHKLRQFIMCKEEFDHVVIFQAIYYVEDRLGLFRHLFNSLKPRGTIYFEEFCRLKVIENCEEQAALDFFLQYLNTLPTHLDYSTMLEESGYEVTVHDISDTYREFPQQRWEKWVEQHDSSVCLYGEDMVDSWLQLYVTAMKLCNEYGLMGGRRFVARKV